MNVMRAALRTLLAGSAVVAFAAPAFAADVDAIDEGVVSVEPGVDAPLPDDATPPDVVIDDGAMIPDPVDEMPIEAGPIETVDPVEGGSEVIYYAMGGGAVDLGGDVADDAAERAAEVAADQVTDKIDLAAATGEAPAARPSSPQRLK